MLAASGGSLTQALPGTALNGTALHRLHLPASILGQSWNKRFFVNPENLGKEMLGTL